MTAQPSLLRTARLLLTELGISPQDLQWTPVEIPTIRDYLPLVIAAAGPGAQRTYGTYWDRILATCGDHHLDEITPTQIEGLMRQVAADRILRRNSRGGVCAAEHLLRAMRAIYTRAITDELLPEHCNPAAQIRMPRRPNTIRRALTPAELTAINQVVASSGNDTPLDTLLIRTHLETACRRCGALRLRNRDIDEHWCLLRLREKNDTLRWQSASPTLIAALTAHRNHRSTREPDAPLFRHRNGNPITSRRYDHLWTRISTQLPWVAAQNISTHWLRHTTITWIERHHGYGIARAYAGHTDAKGASTTTYLHAQLPEIATALTHLTGEPHPLAQPTTPPSASGQLLLTPTMLGPAPP